MKKEDYLASFCREIIKAGKEMLDLELPKLQEEDFFLFKKTGNRLIYEGEYFGRRKFLTVFGILAEFIEDDKLGFGREFERKAVFEKLSYIIEEICRERFWALPAHVNFDALDECTIDLFAAETAGTLAELLYLFHKELKKDTVEMAKGEIIGRVLKPFCESDFPYSWWETDRCNWSAVCAGGVGMAAIYMDRLGALPTRWKEPCLSRVCNAMKCYLGGMEEDGACTEGLGYFSYGMSYFTGFAQVLQEETGIDLLEDSKVHLIATFQQKCYFGHGVSISFSDGSDRECFLPGLTAFLKKHFEDVELPDFSLARGFEEDACYRWLTNERNIRWLRKYDTSVTNRKICSRDYLLPSAQWMIAQDEEGNGFAAKGGNNAENHNHNDIGHFLCVFEGEMLLSDLGAGEYTKDYFSDGRYQILCNRSLGHSVPLINGAEQPEGKEYCADLFEWNQQDRKLTISFAGAYEKGLIDSIQREITFPEHGKKPMQVMLEDRFACNDKTGVITESLVTGYQPEPDNQGVTIKGKNGYCRIEGFSSAPTILPMEHSLHDGRHVTVYLIHWDLYKSDTNVINERLTVSFYKYR